MLKSNPSLVSLMQSYAEALSKLTDHQGKPILAQMAQAASTTCYHHLHIHPYAQSILPDVLYLPHAAYELDRYCARFPASLCQHKYNNRDICNAHLDVHFDYANLGIQNQQQSLPCHIAMHLDEITTDSQIQSHDIGFTTHINLQLSEQNIIQAQRPLQAWYPDLPDFKTRSQAFHQLLYPDLTMPEPIDRTTPLRFTCACCGFPTLTNLDEYDYCDLCDWMDDKAGFDIPADLYFARKQFDQRGYISDTFAESEQPIPPQMIDGRHKLVSAYLALLQSDKQQREFEQLWQHVLDCEDRLKSPLENL